jgi:hypothetical protein
MAANTFAVTIMSSAQSGMLHVTNGDGMASSGVGNPGGWARIVLEFRALGGVLENLTLRADDGIRGLYPEDPAMPCRIVVPRALLVPADAIELVDGQMRIASGTRLDSASQSFFEDYNSVTSWSGGGREDIVRFLSEMQSLPQLCRESLIKTFGLASWFTHFTDIDILEQFLRSRRISIDGIQYIMPIMELLNHDGGGNKIDIDQESISFGGQFAGPPTIRYRVGDTFQIFKAYNFVSLERYTFSLPFEVFDKRLGRLIRVAADTSSRNRVNPDVPTPVLRRTPEADELSFALLGDRADPRNGPRSFWQHIAPQLNVSKTQFFEGLLHYNRQAFLNLLQTVECDCSPAASTIRKLCRLQIEGLNMVSFQ